MTEKQVQNLKRMVSVLRKKLEKLKDARKGCGVRNSAWVCGYDNSGAYLCADCAEDVRLARYL